MDGTDLELEPEHLDEPAPDEPKFPDTMPTDNCPLDGAVDAHGEVYRLVKTDPPAVDDFLTLFELGNDIPEGRECECHGLSVFRDSQDAEAYADKFPYLGEFIAVATLTAEHGQIAETPRTFRGAIISHATWWPYEGIVRQAPFVVKEME